MAYLVTGAAGFIVAAVARRLLDCGETMVGIDNLNDYDVPPGFHPAAIRDRIGQTHNAPSTASASN